MFFFKTLCSSTYCRIFQPVLTMKLHLENKKDFPSFLMGKNSATSLSFGQFVLSANVHANPIRESVISREQASCGSMPQQHDVFWEDTKGLRRTGCAAGEVPSLPSKRLLLHTLKDRSHCSNKYLNLPDHIRQLISPGTHNLAIARVAFFSITLLVHFGRFHF